MQTTKRASVIERPTHAGVQIDALREWNSRIVRAFLAFASATLVAATANAVVINTTVDLGSGLIQMPPLDDGLVSIANGDHVRLNVSFSGGLALTIGDGDERFGGGLLLSEDNLSSFTINNAIIEFLGFSATGGAASLYNRGTQSSGMAFLGPTLANFLSAGQSITFTGYQVSYDVQSIEQSPHDYARLFFFIVGDNVRVVPEPASIVYFGIGIAVLAAVLARRRFNRS